MQSNFRYPSAPDIPKCDEYILLVIKIIKEEKIISVINGKWIFEVWNNWECKFPTWPEELSVLFPSAPPFFELDDDVGNENRIIRFSGLPDSGDNYEFEAEFTPIS